MVGRGVPVEMVDMAPMLLNKQVKLRNCLMHVLVCKGWGGLVAANLSLTLSSSLQLEPELAAPYGGAAPTCASL
jgi:hypothetical protein